MRNTLLLLAVLALAGCDLSTGPEVSGEPAIRTDRTAYDLEAGTVGWRAEIPYVFTNRSGAPVSLANCNGGVALRLDRWQDGGWVEAWSPALPLCLSIPVRLEPGETFQDTVRFFAGYPGTKALPQLPPGEVDSSYRLVWTILVYDTSLRGGRAGTLVPLRYRASNLFRLRP